MKTMKLLRVVAIACAVLSAFAAYANPAEELERIAALSAELNASGISGMLALATDNGWNAPWMPGQWHVENVVKDPEVAKVAAAGRAFGVDLASRLDRVSAELHRPAPAEFFHDR